MSKHHQAIDFRPFQSKADHEREDTLRAHYRSLAIPEVVAALGQRKPAESQTSTKG